jgi:hypothetical protein
MTGTEFARFNGRIEKIRSTLAYIVNQPVCQEGKVPTHGEQEAWIAWARRFAKSAIESDIALDI